jgi:hypothetical protein
VLAERNARAGVDRVFAVFPDGRVYGWHQLNGNAGIGREIDPGHRIRREPLPSREAVGPRPRCSPMPDLLIWNSSPRKSPPGCRRGAEDLKRLVTDALVEAGLTYAAPGPSPRRAA